MEPNREAPREATDDDGSHRAARSRAPLGWVFVLSVVIAAVAIATYFGSVRGLATSGVSLHIPWLLFALGYAASEYTVVHIEFRRDAHSVSLNEIPLVVALVLLSPGHLLLAHLLGAGAVLVLHRRQAILKLVFNLSHFALEDCVAILVFHALVGEPVRIGPSLWAAAIVAAIAAAIVSVITVSVVIWIHQKRVSLNQLYAVIGVALLGAAFNACVGLVAVTVLWTDARGAVLLVAIGIILCFAYREYASLRQRHASLELLYEFTQAVRSSGDAEQIVTDVLAQAREMLRAEIAELAILPNAANQGIDWLVLDGDSDVPYRTVEPALHPSLAALVENGRPVVGTKTTRDPRIRAHLAQREQRDCIVAPLMADGKLIGVFAVANRLGDVTSFDVEDGRLFETIAAHTSVTLQNAAPRRPSPARGVARQPHRAPQPRVVPSAARRRARRASARRIRRSGSCSSTSTGSRRSTTRSATPPATCCCRRSRRGCAAWSTTA